MQKTLVYGVAGCIALACLVLLSTSQNLWSQGAGPKNLQVLKFDNVKDLQMFMQTMTKSLGVTCKYCHDLKDFSKDDPELHKNEARKFMRLVNEVNEKYFKDHPNEQINCFVCHRGREKPVFTLQDWQKIQEEEKQ